MQKWHRVIAAEKIAEGDYDVVEFDDTWVVIVHLGESWYALEDICTHDGAELSGGELEGCALVCPRHFAKFDLATGQALTPPAYEATRVFPIKEEDGDIYLALD